MPLESPNELRAVCQSGKDADPGWYFVHRRLSIYVTWLLLHTSVTPNQVTLLMMLLGVLGAALLVPHSGLANATGFLVLYLAFLLDKVDGEIARYRSISSVKGLLLDRLHHLTVEPLVFLGAAWHEWNRSGSLWVLMAGWAVVVLGNLVDEHQHLSAYILFKHVRGTHQRPPAELLNAPPALESMVRLFRPLKAFRMFIVVLPALALMYALEAATGLPAVPTYLYVAAWGLGALLVFQTLYYFQYKLEAEIGEHATLLAEDVDASAPILDSDHDSEGGSPLRAVNRG